MHIDRVAPTKRLPMSEAQSVIDALTGRQRRAIAQTLDDLAGWGTIHGTLIRFDVQTGDALAEPIKLVGEYDRTPRRGLPDDWIDLFIRLGWIDIVLLGNGWTVWKPTTAGADIREQWLTVAKN